MLVVDANVVVEVTLERFGVTALDALGDEQLVAPWLLWSEVPAALSAMVFRAEHDGTTNERRLYPRPATCPGRSQQQQRRQQAQRRKQYRDAVRVRDENPDLEYVARVVERKARVYREQDRQKSTSQSPADAEQVVPAGLDEHHASNQQAAERKYLQNTL